MTVVPGAANIFSLISESLGDYAAHTSYSNLAEILTVASGASEALGTAYEEDPVKAGAAMIVGLAAVAYLGPEVAFTVAVETLTDSLMA